MCKQKCNLIIRQHWSRQRRTGNDVKFAELVILIAMGGNDVDSSIPRTIIRAILEQVAQRAQRN